MHGEFKTPGGKLVRVDFDVRDGAMRDIVVSGDFFLYPEEALTDITSSLDGVSPALAESDLTAHIAAAIPPGTEWLGSSPEALATAVRRALSESEAKNV